MVRHSKSLGEKSCEIKGGGYGMVAMMLIIIIFNNGLCVLIKFITTNITAAISWLPLLISQLFFHPGFLKATPFYTAWLF